MVSLFENSGHCDSWEDGGISVLSAVVNCRKQHAWVLDHFETGYDKMFQFEFQLRVR
jgi:hypothetical protein